MAAQSRNRLRPTAGLCRHDHLAARSTVLGRRARIGRPSRKRPRSSASASAVAYRRRILGHRLEYDRFQVPRYRRVDLPGPARLVVGDLDDHFQAIVTVERGCRVINS